MEIALGVITSLAATGLVSLWQLIKEKLTEQVNVKGMYSALYSELHGMVAVFSEEYKRGDSNLSSRRQQWVKELQDLAYDVEDCLTEFMHKVMSEGVTSQNSEQFVQDMIDLKKKSAELRANPEYSSTPPTNISKPPTTLASVPCKEPVGMNKPIVELQKLLAESMSKPNAKLKVISIVGMGGLGKTVLARHFYKNKNEKIVLSAWVRADHKSPEVLLEELLHKLQKSAALSPSTTEVDVLPQAEEQPHKPKSLMRWLLPNGSPSGAKVQLAKDAKQETSGTLLNNATPRDHEKGKGVKMENDDTINDFDRLAQRLNSYLGTKRYFIVIIDMTMKNKWSLISEAFPSPDEVDSRIIVTTTDKSVVSCCSSGNSHVYKMSTLTGDDPRTLFSHKQKNLVPLSPDLLAILDKCDGLPLAVLGASSYYGGNFTGVSTNSEHVFKKMCDEVAPSNSREDGTDATERMRLVLASTFEALDHEVQMRLLYFCMFPRDHGVKKKSLTRRLLAEGLIKRSDGADHDLVTFMDRCIIQSTQVSNNGQMKRCKVPGIWLEYITRKAKSRGFIKVCDVNQRGQEEEQEDIRRLSLHPNPNSQCRLPVEPEKVRTLAVFRKKDGQATTLQNKEALAGYKKLRVLDVEGCGNLNDSDFKKMCTNLGLLKYLSLGGTTITKVPPEIQKLHWLETLDLRKTKTHMVPLEVLKLPQLRNLLGILLQLDEHGIFKSQGMFSWKQNRKMKDIQEFFPSDGSKLEILSGFNTGESQGFPQLLSHMPKLMKVKICVSATADQKNKDDLLKGIRKFLGRKLVNDYSLSINIAALEEGPSKEEKPWPADAFLCSLAQTPPSTPSKSTPPFPPSKNTAPLSNTIKIEVPYKVKAKKKSVTTPTEGRENFQSLYSLKLYGKLLQFPQFVGQLNNITELCLSQTSLTLKEVIVCMNKYENYTLRYLKLDEQKMGALNIEESDLIGLERICLVAERIGNITMAEKALQKLVSLHIICEHLEGLSGIKFGGDNLPGLKEVGLHSGVTDDTKGKWEEAAMSHHNRPDLVLIPAEEHGVPRTST